jgi:hypothetical protein
VTRVSRAWSRFTTQDGRVVLKKGASATKLVIMTIGHSTRPVKKFIRLLKAHQVRRLVDVRTVPRSRHNPHFNRSQLSPALHSARLHYTYMAGLAASGMRTRIRSMPAGITPASAVSQITCRRRSSGTILTS